MLVARVAELKRQLQTKEADWQKTEDSLLAKIKKLRKASQAASSQVENCNECALEATPSVVVEPRVAVKKPLLEKPDSNNNEEV